MPAIRSVEGNTLISSDPPLRIRVDAGLPFVGRQTYTIREIADAEAFYFAVSAHGKITRLFMAQFEAFRPEVEGRYHYKLDSTTTLGGLEWRTDVRCWSPWVAEDEEPASDAAHDARFLRTLGLTPIAEMIRLRCLRVLGEDRRAEVLLIYAEDMALHGVGCADEAAVSDLGRVFLEQARAAFTVETP